MTSFIIPKEKIYLSEAEVDEKVSLYTWFSCNHIVGNSPHGAFESGRIVEPDSVNIPDLKEGKCEYDVDHKTVIIYQTEDLEDGGYLIVHSLSCMDLHLKMESGKQLVLKGDSETDFKGRLIEVDYSDPIVSIRMDFKRDIIPSRTYSFKYVMQDAEKIKKEKEEERKAIVLKELITKMNVQAKAGNQLINVYFEPVFEEVSRTVLRLYLCDDTKREEKSRFIGQFESQSGCFYISVRDLVPGTYGYKVIQYSSEGDESVTSPFNTVTVQSYSGSNMLVYER